MWICRYMFNERMPKPLHVHDDSTYADIERFEQLGWEMSRVCLHESESFRKGDQPQQSVVTSYFKEA